METNTPILSFVIPVYNVEKYLTTCLNSIYNQKVSLNLFEVIAVDDCGSDNSSKILSKYKNQYINFTLLKHNKNKGLGAARNTGFKSVKGEYVWFIDSDDLLAPNILSKILKIISSENLDILMFNINTIDDYGIKNRFYATYPQTTKIIDGISFLNSKKVPHWQKPVTAWSRIQKVSFLKENNFTYPEGVYYEDEELHLKEMFICKRMKYISDVCYYYRVNQASIMRSGITIKKLIDKIKVFISCLAILKDYQRQYPQTVKEISRTYLSVLNQQKFIYLQMSPKDRLEIRKELKKINSSIIFQFTSNYIKFLFYITPSLYEKLSWIIK